LQQFKLFQIDFIQDGKKIPYLENKVPINGSKNLIVSVDYDLLPEVLKTIALTIVDADDAAKTFSFLLRVDEEKSVYRATLAPLERAGVYPFFVNILDHKNQGLKKLQGEILVAATIETIDITETIGIALEKFVTQNSCFIFLLTILLLLLTVVIRTFLKHKKKNDEKYKNFHKSFIILPLIAISTLVVFRNVIADQYFCLLSLVTLTAILIFFTYRLLRKILTRKKQKQTT